MLLDTLHYLHNMQALFERNAHARRMAIAMMIAEQNSGLPGGVLAAATMSRELLSAAEAGLQSALAQIGQAATAFTGSIKKDPISTAERAVES